MDPRRVVQRYYEEAVNGGNVALLDEIMAPDFVGHSLAAHSFGREDVRAALVQSRAAYPDGSVEIEDQVAEGDRVASRWRFRWSEGGRHWELAGIQIHRVLDGRLSEVWEVKDRPRPSSAGHPEAGPTA
jgi:predicted ester cyclase